MQVPEHIQQAFSLMEQGRGAEAVELLNRLAAAGDPPACYQLAEWSHEGEIVIRDFALARDLYELVLAVDQRTRRLHDP